MSYKSSNQSDLNDPTIQLHNTNNSKNQIESCLNFKHGQVGLESKSDADSWFSANSSIIQRDTNFKNKSKLSQDKKYDSQETFNFYSCEHFPNPMVDKKIRPSSLLDKTMNLNFHSNNLIGNSSNYDKLKLIDDSSNDEVKKSITTDFNFTNKISLSTTAFPLMSKTKTHDAIHSKQICDNLDKKNSKSTNSKYETSTNEFKFYPVSDNKCVFHNSNEECCKQIKSSRNNSHYCINLPNFNSNLINRKSTPNYLTTFGSDFSKINSKELDEVFNLKSNDEKLSDYFLNNEINIGALALAWAAGPHKHNVSKPKRSISQKYANSNLKTYQFSNKKNNVNMYNSNKDINKLSDLSSSFVFQPNEFSSKLL